MLARRGYQRLFRTLSEDGTRTDGGLAEEQQFVDSKAREIELGVM